MKMCDFKISVCRNIHTNTSTETQNTAEGDQSFTGRSV